nr:reverse transcriptase domain-containing protein [Tanacetum cinerariifolium]
MSLWNFCLQKDAVWIMQRSNDFSKIHDVYADQSTLKYLFSRQDAKPRLIRWVLLLQRFNIEIKDKQGAENLAVDHLSINIGELVEKDIVGKFLDEHLMILKSKLDDEEPWYADYLNYIVGKVVPPKWTPERKTVLLSSSFELCDLGAFIEIITHNVSLNHPYCEVLPSCEGFTAVLAVLKPERLKADRARKSYKSPTKSLFDVGSSKISIFTVNTYVSLGCSGNTTWIMRRTLDINITFHTHQHLKPIFIPKHDSPRRIDDGVVMLVLKARDHQMSSSLVDCRSKNLFVVRWKEVQVTLKVCVDQCRIVVFGTTSEKCHTLQQYRICTHHLSKTNLAPFALAQHQDSMPPSSSRWTVQNGVVHTVSQELVAFFHLVLKMNHIRMKDLNDFKSRAFQVLRFKLSNTSSLAEPVYKCGMSPVCTSSESSGGGSGVTGRSSSRGFYQPCLKFTFRKWALLMSSSFDDYACSSGAISSSISRSAGVNEIDGLSLMLVIVQA